MKYTIVIKCKEYSDYTKGNYIADILLGLMSRNAELNDETQSVIFRNVSKKKAIKIVSRIRRLRNFENIANWTITRG